MLAGSRARGRLKAGLMSALRWIGQHELGVIVSAAGSALGLFVFAKVAAEVGEGEARSIDRALLLALRDPRNLAQPLGPAWLEQAAKDITALGGPPVLTLLTLAAVGYLLVSRRFRAALFVTFSVVGAGLLATALKGVFGRERPAIVPHLVNVSSLSFPSGHSLLSAAVFLTLGALLARLEHRLVVKAYLLLWALLLALLVGMSRVYVGVHWPTDVLGGWAAGAAWAGFCWLFARWLQRRGRLER